MDKIGHHFLTRTKYENLQGESDQEKGITQPPLELGYGVEEAFIDLPLPQDIQIPSLDLRTALEQRRSLRSYKETPLTLDEFSYLLWCTQGIKKEVPTKATFRHVPSAGARHAFETYILVNHVEGLQPGLYRFMATKHKLLPVDLGPEIADQTVAACCGQSFVKTAAATFIWTAVPYRMNYRYQERGYRYLFLDAGHVCQNLYLAAESIDCGACAIAAFDDTAIDQLLGLDGEEQFVIYVGTVGKR